MHLQLRNSFYMVFAAEFTAVIFLTFVTSPYPKVSKEAFWLLMSAPAVFLVLLGWYKHKLREYVSFTAVLLLAAILVTAAYSGSTIMKSKSYWPTENVALAMIGLNILGMGIEEIRRTINNTLQNIRDETLRKLGDLPSPSVVVIHMPEGYLFMVSYIMIRPVIITYTGVIIVGTFLASL